MCDAVEEAKRLAFSGPDRHKVVSLDGTQFTKAGLISGGHSINAEKNARRFDDQALEGLKQVSCCYAQDACKPTPPPQQQAQSGSPPSQHSSKLLSVGKQKHGKLQIGQARTASRL